MSNISGGLKCIYHGFLTIAFLGHPIGLLNMNQFSECLNNAH